MSFSENLKRLRKQKNISGEMLGKIFNVGKTTVSAWERGVHFPKPDTITGLAKFFDVTVDYLMGTSENENTTSDNLIDVSDLTEEQINLLKEIIEAFRSKNNA